MAANRMEPKARLLACRMSCGAGLPACRRASARRGTVLVPQPGRAGPTRQTISWVESRARWLSLKHRVRLVFRGDQQRVAALAFHYDLVGVREPGETFGFEPVAHASQLIRRGEEIGGGVRADRRQPRDDYRPLSAFRAQCRPDGDESVGVGIPVVRTTLGDLG